MDKICVSCEKFKHHKALGLCDSCYRREQSKRNYPKYRERIAKKRKKQYRKYNREIRTPRENYFYHNFEKVGSKKVMIKEKYWTYYPGKKKVHQIIAEKALGRKLKFLECVHHLDGNRLNNHRRNLIVCLFPFHMWIHKKKRILI